MTIARKYLIDYTQTCFYHCISRCVRQGFLLDSVQIDGAHYNYRNDWVQRRLLLLSDVFAIDLLSFAIMDNHTHLVLFANLELANQWTSTEVLKRWSRIGKLPLLCRLYLNQDWRIQLNDIELALVLEKVDEYRKKLTDISVFMSRFNYYIARRANKEDKVSGHFWEARFKSQALLDANAVLSCMQYVDLNPIRAKKCSTLLDSHYTSIKYRLKRATSHHDTLMIPLRIDNTLQGCSDQPLLSLHQYAQRLEQILLDANSHAEFANREIDNTQNWINHANNFEKTFTNSAGESQLVTKFEKQAKLFSGLCEKETQTLSELILGRLLDSQYHCDKTPPYS